MTISAVIWDLGGVLVRTEDPRMRQQLAEKLRINRTELEERVFSGDSGSRAQLGELSASEHWQNVSRMFGLDQEALEEFIRLFWSGDLVDHDLVGFIRSLRTHYKTGLLSNAFSDLRHYLNSVWEFSDAFDDLVISAEVGLVKPDPAIYRLALQRLKIPPEQAVFIDDMKTNVEGARRTGMQAILFQNASQTRQDLENLLNGGVL